MLPDLVISIISYRYILSTRLYTLILKSVPFTLCFVVMWRIMGENGKQIFVYNLTIVEKNVFTCYI